MKSPYYITTTLPYVNADPHIGFAMEITRADVLARNQRLLGNDVFFNTGTDEHGLKIFEEAKASGLEPQEFTDRCARKLEALKKAFNLSYNNFIRTTDAHHIKAAQEFWKRCDQAGDIYKGKQEIKYCVGCELEKTESELVEGKCPLHPNRELEILEEENYFFRFSKYQQRLLDLYNDRPDFVVPDFRLNEIKTFVEAGLRDYSISRLKEKLPWGIEVPGDRDHVMYVWFDALINYVSAIGWPEDNEGFEKWWPGVQIAGKDNLRQQSAMWQAMLMSARLPPSKQVYVEGFINATGGQKMSKSLGNVIDPFEMVNKYGTDAVRYYLLREIPSYSDGDFSEERFVELYNAGLANGLGNLVARVAKLCEANQLNLDLLDLSEDINKPNRVFEKIQPWLDQYRFDKALEIIWNHIKSLDGYLDKERPWLLNKDEANNKLGVIIVGSESVNSLREIAQALKPFLPGTAEKIEKQFTGPTFKSQPALFPRLDKIATKSPILPQSPTDLVVVGKILEISPHPNADSLQIVKVGVGERTLAIVCGAANIKVGQLVPVALPGATVGQPEGKTLKVGTTNIRGVKSEGMLLSGLELGVNENHEEIFVLPKNFTPGETITHKKLKVLK